MDTKIIQITAAQGPLECQLAVAKVLALLLTAIENQKGKAKLLDRKVGDKIGTLHSCTILLEGKIALEESLKWIGTIQWIQKSPYRTMHRRKNWFVGVFEIPHQQKTKLDEKLILFQAVRSSGPGGQHVNKVSSAIRATDPKTGISVFVQESRSQLQNKKIALERLIEKVAQFEQDNEIDLLTTKWMQHKGLERGNPVQTFYAEERKIKQKFNRTKKHQDYDTQYTLNQGD